MALIRKIFGLKPFSGQDEKPLWSYLDQIGLDFRQPMQSLISRFEGHPAGWSEGLWDCYPKTNAPLLAAAKAPLRFQYSDLTDLAAPPDMFWCAVQGQDAALNYAKAVAGLKALFGPGREASSSNTVAREWRFGHARLSCTVWPPEKNPERGQNSRYRLFPETREEASICVQPAWRPPLTSQEQHWCATATPIDLPQDVEAPMGWFTPLTRDWPSTLPPLPRYAGISEDKQAALFCQHNGLVNILEMRHAHAVELHRITAGRGGASATLSLSYQPSGNDTLPQRFFKLAHVEGQPFALDAAAEALAKQLNLGLNSYEEVNA